MPSTGKEKAQKLKTENAKKKAALVTLQSLNGKAYGKMSNPEKEKAIIAALQLLSILDENEKVSVS